MADVVYGLKKREIRAAIRDAEEIHMFIHPRYWDFEADSLPRVKVGKSYAMEFMSKIPNESVPGLEVDGTTVRLWPPESE